MEQFDSTLSSVIYSTLGLRSKLYGYQSSEIIRSLMSIYFCGGSCNKSASIICEKNSKILDAVVWFSRKNQ